MFKFLRRFQKSEDLDKRLVFGLSKGRVPKLSQLKLLPKVLSAYELWILRIAGAILLAFAVAGISIFVIRHRSVTPQSGGTYREAFPGSPRLINPILASSDVDRDLSRLIYGSLLKYNGEGELIPDLAESFTVEGSGLAIRFTLRENLRWHDSQPLTLEDIKFTIAAIQNQAWHSPLWRSFENVSVEIPDAKTIVIRSKAFTSNFPNLFTVGIIPKHIWENVDPASGRLAIWNIKPVGSGPYQFRSLTKSRDGVINALRLSRFEDYYAKPFIKEIVAVFFSDFESALNALREHDVDGVSFIPERLRSKISGVGVNVYKPSFPRFTGLFFQDRKSEVLRDISARRALAAALDRVEIAKIVPGATPAIAPFLPGQIGFAKTLAIPNGDIAGAKKILENGGWRQGKEGWLKNKMRLALTLTVMDEPISLQVADYIKKIWEEMGVGVKLEAASKVTFEQDVLRPRAYEVLMFSITTGIDPDPYPFLHSSQIDDPGLNLSSVKSRDIDAALEQGRSVGSDVARFKHYLQFEQLLLREVPAIVLYSSPYVYVVSKKVRGIDLKMMTAPADRFNGIAQWFMRSRPGWR
ncbi:hypothetical protein A3B21_01020 [Candidatus Uhrbacteria bacterium RIFCSPLOWO2_01_FULL_47_24]|uniref:Solute-binding protein family 5 domain-containing protein n=1 Tax=Candidatus Uhrbacteria bacterium RIFCSPLOWO2_01_FULL_47_24 TaxID=1802401 RepID=A0A1F7UQF9_9BACT|nr:MAG: hypothetical protein A3D58_01190 [Candidatus Uhrbacteria bacterium RIFCSPHIGHO2_02_FULL_46_47]OGL76650.1 MAG: hypothetical protein A3F52_03715 [Candidatus Uhrbacteria bacterium RIFCSPHIGHO2_12_FULL_47_11]OGL79974.1 MAG: hypothetical protein A3B21_01020 [Candidatus Uhrbacteria bacterium RIFCSPLOWO2_01_FULL_47_24]OGL84355.1 MAG: hypothetical protein A3J03_00495 [Candidatus Uhrbacteria bacterium RIFCSPLOWO2_02_FULL_46_25]OGL92013.1 MAG: hypothetical protein A3H11_01640 [Candidatus Uhrbacte